MRSLNPVFKLFGLSILTFLLAAWHDPILNLAVFGVSLLLMGISHVRHKRFLLLLPVLLAAAGMFFTGYYFSVDSSMPVRAESLNITTSALWNALTFSSRVLVYAVLGLLFAFTTDKIELVQSFRRQLHIPAVFAYGLLAAWGIFPKMGQEYRKTQAAFRARGIVVWPFSPSLLVPLLVKSVRWSEALAVAMESKGFNGEAERTEFQPIYLKVTDWVFLLGCIMAIPLSFLLIR